MASLGCNVILSDLEKISNSILETNLADEIKRVEESDESNKEKIIENLEKKDTLGKVNFDSVIISAFDETLKVIREFARQLDDDDCYEYTQKMKKWFNKEWGI